MGMLYEKKTESYIKHREVIKLTNKKATTVKYVLKSEFSKNRVPKTILPSRLGGGCFVI